MSLYDDLVDYCSRNLPEKVRVLLEVNPGIDLAQEDCACIRLAIARNSPEILRDLLTYFNATIPAPDTSAHHKMIVAFDEYIDLEDLSSEIREIIRDHLPLVARKGLIDRAANGDIEIVRELYPYFQDATDEIIETAISHEQDAVIAIVAGMVATDRQKSMIFCNSADLYSKSGKLEKAQGFYEKAIAADHSHITSYLHCANMIATYLCAAGTLDSAAAIKAEEYYNRVLEYNPQYSCAHKKLGILYQRWSQYETTHKQELEIKALESYVRAIECKNPKLQYDTLYHEITHLVLGNIDHPKVQGIISKSNPYHDSRLQEELASLEQLSRQSVGVSDITYSGSEDGGVSSLLDEDIEYEEWDMDRDLDSSNTSEMGLVGHTDSFVDAM